MKILVSLSCIFLSFSLWATPKLVVHYGKFTTIQQRVIDRVFTSKLKDYASKYSQDIDVIIQKETTSVKVVESLKSPDVLGVIFLGHPAIEIRGEQQEERRIVNGFLEDSEGRYLTKSFMSSAHENLKVLSVLTCHESGVLPHYLKSLPEGVSYYRSPTHNLDSLSNPLFEFTSYYSTPKVLDEIFKDLPSLLESYSQRYQSEGEWLELSVSYRDLLSNKFDYEVLLDNTQVGVLSVSQDSRGRVDYKGLKKFKVSKKLWTQASTLTIRPDDPHRPTRDPNLNVVDDIIISKVVVEEVQAKRVLFEGNIHIGDDDDSFDSQIGLSFRRNWRFFERAPRLDYWSLQL